MFGLCIGISGIDTIQSGIVLIDFHFESTSVDFRVNFDLFCIVFSLAHFNEVNSYRSFFQGALCYCTQFSSG